jgi:hypothetical protein
MTDISARPHRPSISLCDIPCTAARATAWCSRCRSRRASKRFPFCHISPNDNALIATSALRKSDRFFDPGYPTMRSETMRSAMHARPHRQTSNRGIASGSERRRRVYTAACNVAILCLHKQRLRLQVGTASAKGPIWQPAVHIQCPSQGRVRCRVDAQPYDVGYGFTVKGMSWSKVDPGCESVLPTAK